MKFTGIETIVLFIILMITSFLVTSLLFWLLTFFLGIFGVVITFTWLRALAFWIICGIIKMLFKGLSK